MEKNRDKVKRWRRARIQKQDLLLTLEKKSRERQEISEWILDEIMDSWEEGWRTTVMETVVAVDSMAWTVAVTHEISKGRWEKWGRVDAKKHRISWSLKVDIQSIPEIRQQEREQHIHDLQGWLLDNLGKEIDMTVAAKMFTKGEKEYEHMLLDLQRLSMGVTVMETDEYHKFATGEEEEAHRELDVLMDPEGKDSPTKNTTMKLNIHEESLMEWGEEEEPVRSRKRKRRYSKRGQEQHQHREHSQQSSSTGATTESRMQSGASKSIIIPPGAAVRRIRTKEQYPLVGCPVLRISIDHPRMAMLNKRIVQAALVIEERSIPRAGEQKQQQTSISQPK